MFLADIDPTRVSDTPEYTPGIWGTFHDATHGWGIYKYVQYDSGAGPVAAVAKNVAYYYTLDGYKNGVVTSDLSDSINIGAGVLQSAPTDGQYCWIKIKGRELVNTALTAGADGNPLTAEGATDGTLDVGVDAGDAAVPQVIVAIAGDISDKEIICDFPF